MKFVTQKLARRLRPLGTTQNDQDPVIQCKFVWPGTRWAFYAIEFDGEDLFWGIVDGGRRNCRGEAYFGLSEHLEHALDFGLSIERDRHFVPCRRSELRVKLGWNALDTRRPG